MTMSAPTAAYEATARAAAPASGKDWPGTYRGTRGPSMLGHQTASHPRIAPYWIADTMTTRTAALASIALIAVLLAAVALAAMFSGEISERSGGIVTTVLGTFATVLAGLLLFLRVETVNAKVDDAATHAETAARKAEVVERKVETVHHDLLNGGLRANVKQAIREAEQDPDIRENRISNVARGVLKDRHEQATRDTVTVNRAELDDLRRRAADQEGKP